MAASFTWWRAKSPTNHPAKSHCSGAQNTGLYVCSVHRRWLLWCFRLLLIKPCVFYPVLHQLLEELSVRGSKTGRDLKLQSKKDKWSICVSVHSRVYVFELLSVCNFGCGVLHSAVCSSGDWCPVLPVLPVWIDVLDCSALKAGSAPPWPSLSPGSAPISSTWPSPASFDPHQPGSALFCSARSNRTCLSRAALTEGRMGWLNLGAGRYMSPNCYFIKLTVIMKKPFLFPCFPSLTFSPPPLQPPPTLSVSLILLRSRTEQLFDALRWRGDETKVCSTLCLRGEKMHSRGGNWEVMRVSQSLRRWMARHCEVVTSVVWRFSVGQRTVLRNGDQVISQHWFHCGTGKQSVYCIEKESASALFPALYFAFASHANLVIKYYHNSVACVPFSWFIRLSNGM